LWSHLSQSFEFMQMSSKFLLSVLCVLVLGVVVWLIMRQPTFDLSNGGFQPAMYAFYECVVSGVEGPVYARTEIVDYARAEALDEQGYVLPVEFSYEGSKQKPIFIPEGYDAEVQSCKDITSEIYNEHTGTERSLFAVVNRKTEELLRYRYTESGGGVTIERFFALDGTILYNRVVTRESGKDVVEVVEGVKPSVDTNTDWNLVLPRDFPTWWE